MNVEIGSAHDHDTLHEGLREHEAKIVQLQESLSRETERLTSLVSEAATSTGVHVDEAISGVLNKIGELERKLEELATKPVEQVGEAATESFEEPIIEESPVPPTEQKRKGIHRRRRKR